VACLQEIAAVDPPNCAIDAREPTDPADARVRFGWDAITFILPCDLSAVGPADFAVTVVPAVGEPPRIAQVTVNDDRGTVRLDRPIDAGRWTCITYVAADVMGCIGSLPADANSDRASLNTDVRTLTDNLDGSLFTPLNLPHCDLDRSGRCTPADVLTALDLLNGSDAFDSWNGRSLPLCPSLPQ
jgi:hypothetical protein